MNFSSFNKFQEELENKFVSTKNQHGFSYENINNVIDNSVPIWNILNITEQEYNLKYNSNSNTDSNSTSNSIDISFNGTVNKDI